MASTDGLVPITRAFLAQFYDKFPFPPLSPEVSLLDERLREENERMPGSQQLMAELSFDSPHKIDENLWKNREMIEEIVFLLDWEHWPATLKNYIAATIGEEISKSTEASQAALEAVVAYQTRSSEKVFGMILTYMPQDFRATLIKQQRERSERKRQAEVEAVANGGGSIRDKYGLLWKQQMERRNQLVMLGSATGVYKTLLRFLVGVPQVLLDFVQSLNDHNGPMEEQRERYGPPLYQLTQFALHIRVFLDLWWRNFDSSAPSAGSHARLLVDSVQIYSSELMRFLKFLGEVFDKSPFLISAEDAGAADGRSQASEYKEAVIVAGKTFEVELEVEVEGSYVAWEFTLTYGKDIGFSIEYMSTDGIRMPMFPYQRSESHQGSFSSPGTGCYRLVWDNTYSTFYKKALRYKVDAIPPVTDDGKIESCTEM